MKDIFEKISAIYLLLGLPSVLLNAFLSGYFKYNGEVVVLIQMLVGFLLFSILDQLPELVSERKEMCLS